MRCRVDGFQLCERYIQDLNTQQASHVMVIFIAVVFLGDGCMLEFYHMENQSVVALPLYVAVSHCSVLNNQASTSQWQQKGTFDLKTLTFPFIYWWINVLKVSVKIS